MRWWDESLWDSGRRWSLKNSYSRRLSASAVGRSKHLVKRLRLKIGDQLVALVGVDWLVRCFLLAGTCLQVAQATACAIALLDDLLLNLLPRVSCSYICRHVVSRRASLSQYHRVLRVLKKRVALWIVSWLNFLLYNLLLLYWGVAVVNRIVVSAGCLCSLPLNAGTGTRALVRNANVSSPALRIHALTFCDGSCIGMGRLI